MNKLLTPLTFPRGVSIKNRFMLAPLTNTQSHEDGVLSNEEFKWLTMRAEGGFGLTMTCAAHVQAQGKGFPGQLGVFSDVHLKGLKRLASTIKMVEKISQDHTLYANNDIQIIPKKILQLLKSNFKISL